MGYAPFPQVTPGITPRVSIGGYNLGVSSHSKHADLAFQAVQCLIQPVNQTRNAIKGGLAPVAASIYDQPAFEKAYPFHQLIKQQLQTYGIRPQTPAYADVTLAIQKALSPTVEHRPEHGGQHIDVTRSSCLCPRRRCCEHRHGHSSRPPARPRSRAAPSDRARPGRAPPRRVAGRARARS